LTFWRLCQDGDDSVRFLDERLPAVVGPQDAEVRELIRKLDSPRFKERAAAERRLAALGRAAESPLRQALKADPTPEQRRRIEALLAPLEPSPRPQGKDLRAVRAVTVLEAIATPAAKKLLRRWAERPADPWLADEAARALARRPQ
jgi:hypothetical protein